ncbi:SLC13 family permease, partial [Planctomycetota bacterium]
MTDSGRGVRRDGRQSSGSGERPGSWFLGVDWRRQSFLLLGLALFFLACASPPLPSAVDPEGREFVLSGQGQLAIGLFLLAATWWVTEVVPIGVTAIMIGIVQALFFIRPDVMPVPPEMLEQLTSGQVPQETLDAAARIQPIKGAWRSFTDFLAPSVWFIFGSLSFGAVFTKTGLTKRLAYRMLGVVGERTSMIYLGCYVMTSALTLIMAHTAVAATVFPLLLAIYSMYTDDEKPTRFGKGLVMNDETEGRLALGNE